MRSTKKYFSLPALAVAALTIASCGGGGGGDGGAGTNNPVSLTSGSAELVSAKVLDSSETVQGATAGPAILTRGSIGPSASEFNFPGFIVQQLTRVETFDGSSGARLTGKAFTPFDFACTDSGTWTISGTDADDSDDISLGDTVNLSFADCVETGVTVNGSISMLITQLSAGFTGAPPYTLGVDVTLTNLSVSAAGHSASSSGDMSMLIADDGAGYLTYDLSGSSLSSTVDSQSEVLSNYLYAFTLDESTNAYSMSLQGTFTHPDIDGSVSFTTITPFTGIEPGDPTAGELHITGAGGSQAWVTADSGGSIVYIDVDADGDDVAETTITSSWSELATL